MESKTIYNLIEIYLLYFNIYKIAIKFINSHIAEFYLDNDNGKKINVKTCHCPCLLWQR